MIASMLFPSLPTALVVSLYATLTAAEVETRPDGLQIEDTRAVECDRPTMNGDTIAVHYRGTLTNGVQFDESWDKGRPFTFMLGAHKVIRGWDEGLLDMCVGTRRKLTIPAQLGYGRHGMGIIPPDSVLVFETQLMGIKGIADPPPLPPTVPDVEPPKDEPVAETTKDEPVVEDVAKDEAVKPEFEQGLDEASKKGDKDGPAKDHDKGSGECRLLGPFALVVQAALGVLALFTLVIKRWREYPRRPVKIWFFDVSKQVVGTALLHVANLAMSTLSSGAGIDSAALASQVAEQHKEAGDKMPNPCSFYLLNLAIDTTIGIPILVVLLKIFHSLFLYTPLANPPESLKSGHYGTPPHVGWWIKQSFIYFLGLFGMKLFVLFLFSALPWLPWVGDWALRWTEGNESLQIAFVMFIFPLGMNGLQYYIIDGFIKEKHEQGYESVASDDSQGEGGEERQRLRGEESREIDDDEDTLVVNGGGDIKGTSSPKS